MQVFSEVKVHVLFLRKLLSIVFIKAGGTQKTEADTRERKQVTQQRRESVDSKGRPVCEPSIKDEQSIQTV